MEKHFVTFYSPGTFVAEATKKPIEAWDPEIAVRMARKVSERYGAKPYGFQFSTCTREADDLDSHVSATSPMYYIGGKIETLAEVKTRALPEERILRTNMECNGWDRVIVNDNSWRITRPLEKTDIILNVEL